MFAVVRQGLIDLPQSYRSEHQGGRDPLKLHYCLLRSRTVACYGCLAGSIVDYLKFFHQSSVTLHGGWATQFCHPRPQSHRWQLGRYHSYYWVVQLPHVNYLSRTEISEHPDRHRANLHSSQNGALVY